MSSITPISNESFLIEDLMSYRSQKESAFVRAAKITPLVCSVTLGPNSTYRSDYTDEEQFPERITISVQNKPDVREPRRVVSASNSPVTTNDLRAMQQKLQFQNEEKLLKEEVRKRMEERLQSENEHHQRVQNMIEIMQLEAERKHKAKVDALEKQIEAALQIEEQDEMVYQKQRTEMTKNRRKILEQQEKELRDNLKKLDDFFGKLETRFNQITQICNQEMAQVIESHKRQFEALVAQKNANRTSLDGMKNVCMRVEELCQNLLKSNKDYEAESKVRQAQKDEEEKQAQAVAAHTLALAQAQAQAHAQAQAKATEQIAQAAVKSAIVPQTVQLSQNAGIGQHFNELMQFLSEKQAATTQLTEAKEMETLRFALKMAVNQPINILNEQNKTSLIEGFQKLHNLMSGQRITTSKGVVAITDHPEANDWTKLRLAEKLIDVCDKKPETTFFVAALTVALWQKFPDFGQIFTAKLFKECPFLAPHKPPQRNGQSDIDFLKSWGYRVSENTQPEQFSNYQSRTSKFAVLIAAIWITPSRRDENSANPFGIENGWKFFISMLSSQPDPMYIHIIDKILEVSGSTLHAAYGKQFEKLIITVRDYYLRSVERNVDESMKGSFDRLRDITLAKFFNEKRFQQPKGKLVQNFW